MASVITNVIKTKFTTEGSAAAVKDTESVGRAQTRLGQASAGNGRQFSAQASGLGGLVGAYAAAAATVFSLQAAFSALASSAQFSQTIDGLNTLAAASGETGSIILANVEKITKGQLTIASTAGSINLALSAGFKSDQISGLADVAMKASKALGRDLSDSMDRVVKGSAKMEAELLDELGIYTKIGPATRAYAASLGISVTKLTEFQRRQAFANAVITEGERKYASINSSIATTAQKMQAFGATVLNIVQSFGMFLADTLAPVADFLTNNLSAAFGVVGIAAGMAAKKGILILEGALDSLAKKATLKASAIEDFFLKFSKSAQTARDTANKAVAGINLGAGVSSKDASGDLKALKAAAKERTLTGAELAQAQTALTAQKANFDKARTTAEAKQTGASKNIADLTAARNILTAAEVKDTVALAANTIEIEKNQKALAAAETTLANLPGRYKDLEVQQKAVGKAQEGNTASWANFTSSALVGTTKLVSYTAKSVSSVLSLGSSILSIVSIVNILGSAIAGILGKGDEFNGFIQKLGSMVKGFFTSTGSKEASTVFTGLASGALSELEKTDSKLKEVDSFTFKTKALGIEFDITKTKEDLVKDVGNALATAARDGQKTFGESMTSTTALTGGAVGAALGAAGGAAAGAALATAIANPELALLFGSVGSKLGAVLGGAVGDGAGTLLDQIFGSKLPQLADDLKKQLMVTFNDPKLFAGPQGDQLAKALQIIEDEAGAYKNLSLAGRKVYENEQKMAIQLAGNLNNYKDIYAVSQATGVSADEVMKRFKILSQDASGIVLTPKLNIPNAVDVKIHIVNQEELLKNIDAYSAKVQEVLQTPATKSYIGRTAPDKNKDLASLSAAEKQISLLEKEATQIQANYDQAVAELNRLKDSNAAPDKIKAQKRVVSDLKHNTIDSWIFDGQDQLSEIPGKLADARAEAQKLREQLGLIRLPDSAETSFRESTVLLRDLVIGTEAAKTATLKASNAIYDLGNAAMSGNVSLEQLSQQESIVKNLLLQTVVSTGSAANALDGLKKKRIELNGIEVNSTAQGEAKGIALKILDEQIAAQQAEVDLQRTSTADLLKDNDLQQTKLKSLHEQLTIAADLQSVFGNLAKESFDGIGTYVNDTKLALTEADKLLAKQQGLNKIIDDGTVAYANQLAQQAAVRDVVKKYNLSDPESQALMATNKELADQTITGLNLTGDAAIAAKLAIQVADSAQAKSAENLTTALTIQKNLYIDLAQKAIQAATTATKAFEDQVVAAKTATRDLQAQSSVVKIKFEIDSASIASQMQDAINKTKESSIQQDIQVLETQKDSNPLKVATMIASKQEELLAAQRKTAYDEHFNKLSDLIKQKELIRATHDINVQGIEGQHRAAISKLEADRTAAATAMSLVHAQGTALVEGGNSVGKSITDAFGSVIDVLNPIFTKFGMSIAKPQWADKITTEQLASTTAQVDDARIAANKAYLAGVKATDDLFAAKKSAEDTDFAHQISLVNAKSAAELATYKLTTQSLVQQGELTKQQGEIRIRAAEIAIMKETQQTKEMVTQLDLAKQQHAIDLLSAQNDLRNTKAQIAQAAMSRELELSNLLVDNDSKRLSLAMQQAEFVSSSLKAGESHTKVSAKGKVSGKGPKESFSSADLQQQIDSRVTPAIAALSISLNNQSVREAAKNLNDAIASAKPKKIDTAAIDYEIAAQKVINAQKLEIFDKETQQMSSELIAKAGDLAARQEIMKKEGELAAAKVKAAIATLEAQRTIAIAEARNVGNFVEGVNGFGSHVDLLGDIFRSVPFFGSGVPTTKHTEVKVDTSAAEIAINTAIGGQMSALISDAKAEQDVADLKMQGVAEERKAAAQEYLDMVKKRNAQKTAVTQDQLAELDTLKNRAFGLGAAAGGAAASTAKLTGRLAEFQSSIQGSVESAFMGLNDLIITGKGSIREIIGGLFKSIEEEVFKQTIATPLSNIISNWVTGAFKTAFQNKDIMNSPLSDIAGSVVGAKDPGKNVMGDAAVDKGSKFLEGISKKMSSAVEGASKAIGSAANTGASVVSGAGKILSGATQTSTATVAAANTAGASTLMSSLGPILAVLLVIAAIASIFGGKKKKKPSSVIDAASTVTPTVAAEPVSGSIPKMATGSLVRDSAPTMLEPGEFVIRKPMVNKVGTAALESINATGTIPNESAKAIDKSSMPKLDTFTTFATSFASVVTDSIRMCADAINTGGSTLAKASMNSATSLLKSNILISDIISTGGRAVADSAELTGGTLGMSMEEASSSIADSTIEGATNLAKAIKASTGRVAKSSDTGASSLFSAGNNLSSANSISADRVANSTDLIAKAIKASTGRVVKSSDTGASKLVTANKKLSSVNTVSFNKVAKSSVIAAKSVNTASKTIAKANSTSTSNILDSNVLTSKSVNDVGNTIANSAELVGSTLSNSIKSATSSIATSNTEGASILDKATKSSTASIADSMNYMANTVQNSNLPTTSAIPADYGTLNPQPVSIAPESFTMRQPIAINSTAVAQPNTQAAAPTINIKNEGTPKQAESSQPRFDGEKYVVDIIMRDLSTNGPIRRSLRGGAI